MSNFTWRNPDWWGTLAAWSTSAASPNRIRPRRRPLRPEAAGARNHLRVCGRSRSRSHTRPTRRRRRRRRRRGRRRRTGGCGGRTRRGGGRRRGPCRRRRRGGSGARRRRARRARGVGVAVRVVAERGGGRRPSPRPWWRPPQPQRLVVVAAHRCRRRRPRQLGRGPRRPVDRDWARRGRRRGGDGARRRLRGVAWPFSPPRVSSGPLSPAQLGSQFRKLEQVHFLSLKYKSNIMCDCVSLPPSQFEICWTLNYLNGAK